MAMEVVQVEHFAHDHPLKLIKKEETDDSWDLSCYGCQQPISISSSDSSSYYGCKRCAFFLHKICAEPPDKMTHPSHPQHPLTLLPNTPLNYNSSYAVCDVCREPFNRFTYHCSLCKYDIDMKCALVVLSIQQNIEHTSHPHQLIPMQKESMFSCDACGIKHEGTSFLCTTCGFWINQKCASLPINVKLNHHHHHTLSLIYFIPQIYEAMQCCSFCSKEICRRNWAYSCSECHYTVHLHCVVSDKEYSTLRSALQLFSFLFVNDFLSVFVFFSCSYIACYPLRCDYRNNETENQSHDRGLNPIRLSSSNSGTATSDADLPKVMPVPDDSADIITQFIKNMAEIQGKHEGAAEIKHGSSACQCLMIQLILSPSLSRTPQYKGSTREWQRSSMVVTITH